jgi:hypothetical protein
MTHTVGSIWRVSFTAETAFLGRYRTVILRKDRPAPRPGRCRCWGWDAGAAYDQCVPIDMSLRRIEQDRPEPVAAAAIGEENDWSRSLPMTWDSLSSRRRHGFCVFCSVSDVPFQFQAAVWVLAPLA